MRAACPSSNPAVLAPASTRVSANRLFDLEAALHLLVQPHHLQLLRHRLLRRLRGDLRRPEDRLLRHLQPHLLCHLEAFHLRPADQQQQHPVELHLHLRPRLQLLNLRVVYPSRLRRHLRLVDQAPHLGLHRLHRRLPVDQVRLHLQRHLRRLRLLRRLLEDQRAVRRMHLLRRPRHLLVV